jgi:hypothetical protein
MEDDVQRSERRRSAAERALRGAASPFLGYFDRRFQDVHDHLDDRPALEQLAAEFRRELSQTRADVAADTDTIAELAFTLERFADLFTMRMEELARQLGPSGTPGADLGTGLVELPFAFATAAHLERGASAATIGDDGRLSIGLAALGLEVTAVEPAARIVHPDVAVVTARFDEWAGTTEPLDAVFALAGDQRSPGSERPATREELDHFRKALQPTGVLVLGIRVGAEAGSGGEDVDDLFADWDVERRERFVQDAGGAWRRSDAASQPGILVVRATPHS